MKTRLALALSAVLLLVPAAAAGAAELHTPHVGTVAACDGPVLWHFVHNQVGANDPTTGSLTTTFATAGAVTVDASKVLQRVRQYDVLTPAGDTLLGATDDITGGRLMLSHTECLPGEPPPPGPRCVAGTSVFVTWGVELGDPTRWGLYERATSPVSLLPGTYEVTLTSTDVNHRPAYQSNQDQE